MSQSLIPRRQTAVLSALSFEVTVHCSVQNVVIAPRWIWSFATILLYVKVEDARIWICRYIYFFTPPT